MAIKTRWERRSRKSLGSIFIKNEISHNYEINQGTSVKKCAGGKYKTMGVKKDKLGRVQRKCRKRSHPIRIFRKKEFKARYRLSKKVVKHLATKFKPHNSTKGKNNGGGLDNENRFCLALRYLSTGGIYSLCGDTQHVSKALVSRAVRDVSNYFFKHAKEYIHWPESMEDKMDNAKDFYQHKDQKTPRVIGLVDGTHIPILRPKTNESCYVNRKNYHSINTTMFCDFNRRIINVDARWAGSVNDAYAFNSSPVGDMCKEGDLRDDNKGPLGKFVLLGDSGYGLRKNLFTPYKNAVGPKQKAYNKWHRRIRARVEQTIGILKQRFRCLDSASGYLHHTPQRAAKIIVTCCCLHNVAMDHGIKVTTHKNDPWFPKRKRLDQPRQRTQRQRSDAIKSVRDAYVNHHF